ncbi:MAG: hypothetical protein Q7S20_06675 [Gemmatimonadaceae bacterium]|nr:hypothetical protein [Gemmatimonadaceae bacterium]
MNPISALSAPTDLGEVALTTGAARAAAAFLNGRFGFVAGLLVAFFFAAARR